MRILHLTYGHIHSPWLAGGGNVRCHEINRRLARRHDVEVLCGRWPGGPSEQMVDGVRYRHVGLARSYSLSRATYALAAGRLCRTMDADIVVEDISGFTPVLSGLFRRHPAVAVVHDIGGRHLVRSHGLKGVVALRLERLSLKTHRHFIVVSQSTADALHAEVETVDDMSIIHNGFDDSLLELEPEEERVVLFLGRMSPYMKGLDVLFPAFRQVAALHPDVSLTVAGFGDIEPVRNLAAQVSLNGAVRLRGAVTTDQKRDLLRRCMAVVMPSRFEGWGIVAIAAAACGKPVIGTRVPGLVDSVRDGETGILVPSEDVGALADAICTMVEDAELRHRLGAAGREWARNFSWDRAAEEQERFYEQVVEMESRRS